MAVSDYLPEGSAGEVARQFISQNSAVVGGIATFLLTFVAVYIVGKLVAERAVRKSMELRGMDKTITGVAVKVTRVLVLAAALSVSLTAAGFPSFLTAFATLGGALGLALGFASQKLISNFVSGLFILKDKPFRKGDWIEWSGNSGIVEEIDLRVTRLKTFDNELLTVPNSNLANAVVKNPVALGKLRQKFLFGISYDDDIGRATSIILEEAEASDGIMDDPEPTVRMVELGDSSVGLQARIWIDNPSRADFVKVKSDFVRSVKERFDEEGVEIPYPNVELSGSVEMEEAS